MPSAAHSISPTPTHPPMPISQRSPTRKPSSISPSQSSSIPLPQRSGSASPGSIPHVTPAPSSVQIVSPARAHAPVPTVQDSARRNPSSTSPSQSSSMPFPHRSASGDPGSAPHTTRCPSSEHVVKPDRTQAPTPVVQGASIANPSSVSPSQSSSTPLPHRSGSGAPGSTLQISRPSAAHSVSPAR